jgi:four helix bundle protein
MSEEGMSADEDRMPEAARTKDTRQIAQDRNQKPEAAGRLKSAKELEVYKLAYQLSMRIFQMSKAFPSEERFALKTQILRSSRSVCLNLREARAKRRYEAHFISKLTDCDGENSETESSRDFALDCGYITEAEHREATEACRQIGRMLGGMLAKPASFLPRPADLCRRLVPLTSDALLRPTAS